jgi:hypothetical protein
MQKNSDKNGNYEQEAITSVQTEAVLSSRLDKFKFSIPVNT